MCFPKDTVNWKTELLIQAYQQDRMQLAKEERLLRLLKSKPNWSKRLSCAACKVLYYRLVSPLYHQLKLRVEATGAS